MIINELSAKSKFNRDEITPFVKYLNRIIEPYCDQYMVVGSYRRKKPVIGDLEILVTGITTNKIATMLSKSKKLTINKVLWHGAKKMGLVISYDNIKNLQFEVYVTDKSSWPAALLTRTGNATFNIALRNKAKKMGLLLNEYGLFDKHGVKFKYTRSEEAILNALGIEWHEPEERSI